MKPHLKRLDGLWYCYIKDRTQKLGVGIGYTPLMAYRDWEAM